MYLLHTNMDKSLKPKLLGFIENIYVKALKKNHIGYGNHTCLQMIDHLKANY